MCPNARESIADGEVYHLIVRGNNRMNVFHSDEDFKCYLMLIRKYKKQFPILLYHYCLMSNHVHLLARLFQAYHLPKFMQGVSQSYANYYKRAHQHSGHLWQGRFKSFHIDEYGYLLECGRYIERNPVRAKMAKDPAEWSWSSHRHYALGELNDVIDDHDLYLDLGGTFEERQKA